ncbi:MAG: DNA topoisomerase I subunit omega [Gammaproteobacteria bacterium]|nr:DNA topoisomerase I subunit omega [Gammaproteobacteria bacterium]|tara:strand:+ start:463 stop:3279 length:2817 start_codon:yes stop_codon:yes gene_type:complete
MARSLVIVESPAKAKTINRYLGKDFIVKSSVGHIRDLPVGGQSTTDPKTRAREAAKTRKLSPEEKAERQRQRARERLVKRMGIDPGADWQADYQVLPGKEKVVDELSRLAKNADAIYLATDLDREGEAIAWHLRETIGGDPARYRRVVFNEITRKAIQEAFAEPGELNMNRVNAQQARRFLDRVVGFELSPLLWQKVARGLSAGRVQSVAVRLVVEREREIRAFVPEEYWEGFADLNRAGDGDDEAARRFQVVRDGGENFRPGDGDTAREAMARLESRSFEVTNREDRPTRSKPQAPFITSTLQQAASTWLGFSVKKTMTMAQRLYEAGYITYMRTDSTNLSADAVSACRDYIGKEFGDAYLPDSPQIYTSKADAQEAHEAIRPSNVGTRPEMLTGVDDDAVRLYRLIRAQFLRCQMPPAEYLSTSVTVQAGEFELKIRGRILKFDGYTRVPLSDRRDSKEEDRPLPDYQVGESLQLAGVEPVQHFTKPPPRYSEASLVRELEKRGIGRPSTYAAIISTIQDRGYVTLRNRRFHAEKIGELVTDRLMEQFKNLMDYGFTAELEEELDRVAEGDLDWRGVLNEFYGDFSVKLEEAADPDGGMRANTPTDTDIPCEKCGRHMQIRNASTGVFLGCSGYGLPPKERCTHTVNLVPGEEVVDEEADEEGESRLLRAKHRCPRCGSAMDSYLIDEQRKLHVCGSNPDCAGFEVEKGQFRIKGYDGPVIECDKCGADMQLKTGRFGKYFGCTADDCRNTRKLLRNGEPAPPKADPVPMPELRCEKVDDYYLLRDGASGIFLAASQFPKNRETRAPLVSEIRPHANELDPKFAYLLDAPDQDPDGRPTVIRFSRKDRSQYVQSEEDGKATGWRAVYQDGRWVAEDGRKFGGATARKGARKSSTGKSSGSKSAGNKSAGKRSTASGGKSASGGSANGRGKATQGKS